MAYAAWPASIVNYWCNYSMNFTSAELVQLNGDVLLVYLFDHRSHLFLLLGRWWEPFFFRRTEYDWSLYYPEFIRWRKAWPRSKRHAEIQRIQKASLFHMIY